MNSSSSIRTNRIIVSLIIVGLAVVAAPFILSAQVGVGASVNANVEATICTMDAKLCPDGSYVGRSGPNCEFKCPGDNSDTPARVCPQDAKLCPDGSYVGRTGPNCQFVCPLSNTDSNDGSGVNVEGNVESNATISSSGDGLFPGANVGGWLTRLFKGFSASSNTSVDEEVSVQEDGLTVAEEANSDIAIAEEPGAAPGGWLGSFVSKVRGWFGFGKRGVGADGQPRWGDVRFGASPKAGEAPLTVTFTASVRGNAPRNLSLDFGDGKSTAFVSTEGNCEFGVSGRCVSSAEHTYTARGTYIAVLSEISNPCGDNEQCLAPISMREVGRVIIQVSGGGGGGGNTSAAFSADVTSGQAPLTVRFTATLRGSAEQYFINFGDGRGDGTLGQCSFSDPMKCSVEHTYVQPGTYTASLVQSLCPRNAEGCLAPEIIVASVIIKVY